MQCALLKVTTTMVQLLSIDFMPTFCIIWIGERNYWLLISSTIFLHLDTYKICARFFKIAEAYESDIFLPRKKKACGWYQGNL
jgi:hypothetical protein